MWPFTSDAKIVENVRKCRQAHYRERFGSPSDELEPLPGSGPVTRILEFEPTATRSLWTYVTDGMSDQRQDKALRKQPYQSLRVELLLHVRDEAGEWAAPLLSRLGGMPWGEQRFFAFWHVIDLGAPVDEYGKGPCHKELTSVLLMPPHLDGEVTSRVTRAKEPVDLLWVVPIHPSERELALRRAKDLDLRFEAAGYETLADLDRKPIDATP